MNSDTSVHRMQEGECHTEVGVRAGHVPLTCSAGAQVRLGQQIFFAIGILKHFKNVCISHSIF